MSWGWNDKYEEKFRLGRVFAIFKNTETGAFKIEEGCDSHFTVDMTNGELRALGKKIMEIADEE
jgi:hypothetical protein